MSLNIIIKYHKKNNGELVPGSFVQQDQTVVHIRSNFINKIISNKYMIPL